MQLQKQERNKGNDKYEAAQALLVGDMEEKILEKIKLQWKTIGKAFKDLNIEKTGKISKQELRGQLDFWGYTISQEVFDKIFAKFDIDGDGKISYKDFQLSIEMDMFPAEALYFRLDKK